MTRQTGSVVFDKRRKTWNFLWRETGNYGPSYSVPSANFSLKTEARRAAETLRRTLQQESVRTML